MKLTLQQNILIIKWNLCIETLVNIRNEDKERRINTRYHRYI